MDPKLEKDLQEFVSDRLSRLMIVQPCRDYPEPECERFTIGPAVAGGAMYCPNAGITDIAHHRNLLHAKALHQLDSERGRRTRYVCWLDDDHVVNPLQFAYLTELIERLRRVRARSAVSAGYVVGSQPTRYAAKPIAGDGSDIVTLEGGMFVGSDAETIELVPAYTGMGCLMLDVETFVFIAESSEWIEEKQVDGTPIRYPAVCASVVATGLDGKAHWASEDTVYCERCWQRDVGVYLAKHVRIGHIRETRQILFPDDTTELHFEELEEQS